MSAAIAAGADVIELGMPWSDPSADGPAIQAAMQRALAAGGGLRRVARAVPRRARRAPRRRASCCSATPTRSSSWAPRSSRRKARDAGADAVLSVDYPPDEDAELTVGARAAGPRLHPAPRADLDAAAHRGRGRRPPAASSTTSPSRASRARRSTDLEVRARRSRPSAPPPAIACPSSSASASAPPRPRARGRGLRRRRRRRHRRRRPRPQGRGRPPRPRARAVGLRPLPPRRDVIRLPCPAWGEGKPHDGKPSPEGEQALRRRPTSRALRSSRRACAAPSPSRPSSAVHARDDLAAHERDLVREGRGRRRARRASSRVMRSGAVRARSMPPTRACSNRTRETRARGPVRPAERAPAP